MGSVPRASLDSLEERGLDQQKIPPKHLLVGDGRTARHLSYYFELLGFEVARWSRRENTVQELAAQAESVNAVWLLISDQAIEPFLAAHPFLRHCKLIHASGSLVVDGVIGAHPLMTFGPELYPSDEYRAMAFVLDAPVAQFAALLPGLPNPVFTIHAEDRARYHALCVMAGNFTALLWNKLFEDFERRLSLPASAAMPYLARVFVNLRKDSKRALTGPLVRGDHATMARNLASLEGDPYADVYRAFVQAYTQSTKGFSK